MEKKYIVKYEIIFDDGKTLKGKEIKIAKCLSELQAQIRLEDYLKRKYINFKQLIVIECKQDVDDFLSQFGDIFGNSANFFGGK